MRYGLRVGRNKRMRRYGAAPIRIVVCLLGLVCLAGNRSMP